MPTVLNPAGRRRRFWGVLLLTAVVVAVGVVVVQMRGPHAPAPPDVPADLLDPQVAQVVRQARAAVLEKPNSGAAWGRLGMVLGIHDFSDEAQTCFVQAERLDPRDPRWPYLLGLALLRTEPEAAVPKLERAAELAGPEPGPRLELARTLVDLGRLNEAEWHFRRLQENQPDDPWATLGLGRIALERGQARDALPHLTRAAGSPFTRKSAHLLLLEIYRRLDDQNAVDEELRTLAGLPDDASRPDRLRAEYSACLVGRKASVSRAIALYEREQIREAIALLQETVLVYPEAGDAWRVLGRAQLRASDPASAERSLRRAVSQDPASSEARYYLGVALKFQEKVPEAADNFRQAIELKPDYGLAHFNLGVCLRQQGQTAAATDAFRAAVRYMPQSASAYLTLANHLASDGHLAEALEVLQLAVKLTDDAAVRRRLDELRDQLQAAGKRGP